MSEFLTSKAAATKCGYTPDQYAQPVKAFRAFVDRWGIPKAYAGSRLRFDPKDLDRAIAGKRAQA